LYAIAVFDSEGFRVRYGRVEEKVSRPRDLAYQIVCVRIGHFSRLLTANLKKRVNRTSLQAQNSKGEYAVKLHEEKWLRLRVYIDLNVHGQLNG